MKRALYNLTIVCALFAEPICVVNADIVLEPFTYSEDFETRSLRAWASYPLWQDTAYDPNFRVNVMVPGDPNISIVQKVTPYTNVDNYAGAQKLLDMYLIPGSSLSLRYYLKTNLPVEFFKIRLAAGTHGKIDFTVSSPPTNQWEWLTVTFNDFVQENPLLAGKDKIKVKALAVLAKIPDADPAMPIYLGLDDVVVKGARTTAFQFAEPLMYKLSEFKPYISQKHYRKGDTFRLKGQWPLDAGKVTLSVASFTDRSKTIFSANLNKNGETWSLKPFRLSYQEGLYLTTLKAFNGNVLLADTEFTFLIAPENIHGKHPRLWFDTEKKKWVENRLKSEKFKKVFERMASSAKSRRDRLPVEEVKYVADQFPDEYWLPTLNAWIQKTIGNWRSAAEANALSYAFHGDREAGEYVVQLLAKLSTLPDWNHPWMVKRGRYNYHPTGVMAHKFALAYDLTYDLMSEYERKIIRRALMDKLVLGSHRTYVVDDMVTCDTSNWVAHIVGGALMCMAAIYDDSDDSMEPYFTGAVFKLRDLIERVHGRDGSYGEGLSYNSYTNYTLQESLPSLENVFNIDLTGPMNGAYREAIWAGIIKDKKHFYFGDSGSNYGNLWRWAWLVPKYRDPLLGWFYNFIQTTETFYDALYETEDIPQKDPFDETPVKVFRDVGTTVFKSGWEPDDFVFVLRTGPFYNHQHIDQGTFWLADRGSIFIEERHGSTYYDDPLYQPWYTQSVGHSTILIDHNHQSQRVGNHKDMAEGFHDHAFVTHFLDGKDAAFTSGDIGRLYWGKVSSIQRNVLYLKPRTLIMLDTVVPAERDVDVTLLYQTLRLEDITADEDISTITKNGNVLHIKHMYPEHIEVESVETPHYLYTQRNERPLIKEGMLTVASRTSGNPLVIANLLTTTTGGEPNITTEKGDGFMLGTAEGKRYVFSTQLNAVYEVEGFKTDALAMTWHGSTVFAAMCKTLWRENFLVIESNEPVTFEHTGISLKYYHCLEDEVILGIRKKPATILVNGIQIRDFKYDAERKAAILTLPAGEGTVVFK